MIIGNQFVDSNAHGANKSGSCDIHMGGGGIGIVDNAESEISQNTFESNYAYSGGAILNHGAKCNIADNSFTTNKAKYGGAIQLINLDEENYLKHNVFTANGDVDTTSCEIGGAISLMNSTSTSVIELSKFIDNISTGMGGALSIQNSSQQQVVNNQFSTNGARKGGGLFFNNTEIKLNNNTIVHNWASSYGGGLYGVNSRIESYNNLHWSNSSPQGFEMTLEEGSISNLYNSFIAQTTNAAVTRTGSTIDYDNCYGEGGESPVMIDDIYNYNLQVDSPCVNNGDSSVYHTDTDLNNRVRIVGGTIDIGAYEYSGTTISIDPIDSLTVWDDSCITISAPINLSIGKKLVIEDNVTVFFEDQGSLYVENSELETGENVSFISHSDITDNHLTFKEAYPVHLDSSSVLGVRLKTDGTYLNVQNSLFNDSHLIHHGQSLVINNSEFSSSTLDAVNTNVTNDTLAVTISASNFHDKPDSTAIRIYSYPNFVIKDNQITNFYNGISLFESGHGKWFTLDGNTIEGNQYGYGIQAYHSNVDMASFGSVKNNYVGLGGLRNSSFSLYGHKEPPFQAFCNNYSEEMAFTHDSFPKELKFNVIYDSIHPQDVALLCAGCDDQEQHDITYNYWNMVNPHEVLHDPDRFIFEPIWDMDENIIPEVSADQDLFELAKYNLRIGHCDLAVIQFKELIQNYPDTKYKEEAAKLLMAAGCSSSSEITDLQYFYATEPNLHNELGIEKLAEYLANYCSLKLEDYIAVIEWYEKIIENPQTPEDYIYAVIDLAYTYLLMNESDNRAQHVGKYSGLIPESMKSFRRDLDGYINQLLHPVQTETPTPPVPQSFALKQNYPNPFNPTTTISFEIPEDAPATLAIYNIRGQLVKEIRYDSLAKGYHQYIWDGRDMNSRSVSSGIYFYRMIYQGKAVTKKMCIMK
jgi:tetratricopeptide (TPR) repeat protein